MMPMHNVQQALRKKLFLLPASVLLTACTQMPQFSQTQTSEAEYDSSTSQGITINELLANARNNTVANPYMADSTNTPTPTHSDASANSTLSANEEFALVLEREKMRNLLDQAQQAEQNEKIISDYQADTYPIETNTGPVSKSEEVDTNESATQTITLTEVQASRPIWTPPKRDKGENLYHIQRKAKEKELKAFLITLSFQTNSADIDAILEEELDHFSRLHYKEQLVINCAMSNEEDSQQAYETAMIRCLSIETFFKQRNHITMSQVLGDIEPNQVLIFSDGQGF